MAGASNGQRPVAPQGADRVEFLSSVSGVPLAFLTEEVAAAIQVRHDAEQAHFRRATLHYQEDRAQGEEIDRILLAMRPEYPSPEMLQGIAEAVKAIRQRRTAKSHHGDPTPASRLVAVEPKNHRINVYAGAPVQQAIRSHERIWSFTDQETAVIREAIVSEGGMIVQEWPHDDGHGFIVFARSENTEGGAQ